MQLDDGDCDLCNNYCPDSYLVDNQCEEECYVESCNEITATAILIKKAKKKNLFYAPLGAMIITLEMALARLVTTGIATMMPETALKKT